MRRIILMAVASSALALAVPGVASAHRVRHHSRKHHAHKARVRHFGSLASTTAPTTSSPASPAGKVKSFTEGVLTITLADESTVSGKVTEDTDLRCVKPGTEGEGDDDHGDDDARAVTADHHGDEGGGDQGDDDQGDDDGPGGGRCTVAALTPGATVLGAELRIGPGGAVWKEIVLSA